MRRYKPKDIPVKQELLDEVPIHGQLNIEQIVFRLMELTNHSASQDESIFASYIRLLMSYLPSHKRDTILERSDEFMEIAKTLQYKYNCGVPLGTPEHPINGSPALIEEEVYDWYKLLEIILDIFEECGVTWKIEPWTIETGKLKIEENTKFPTPVYRKDMLKKEPEKRFKRCAICGLKIERGTGANYNGKLVHREKCLSACKAEFLSEKT